MAAVLRNASSTIGTALQCQEPREPIIVIDGLGKWFGSFQVLKEINLTVG